MAGLPADLAFDPAHRPVGVERAEGAAGPRHDEDPAVAALELRRRFDEVGARVVLVARPADHTLGERVDVPGGLLAAPIHRQAVETVRQPAGPLGVEGAQDGDRFIDQTNRHGPAEDDESGERRQRVARRPRPEERQVRAPLPEARDLRVGRELRSRWCCRGHGSPRRFERSGRRASARR